MLPEAVSVHAPSGMRTYCPVPVGALIVSIAAVPVTCATRETTLIVPAEAMSSPTKPPAEGIPPASSVSGDTYGANPGAASMLCFGPFA